VSTIALRGGGGRARSEGAPSAEELVRSPSDRFFGRVPAVAAFTCIGLLLCAIADALSRGTVLPSVWIYWAGVTLIAAPIFYVLCSARASSRERLTLVCMLGLGLYAVKLMHEPFGFTMTDEFPHAFNLEQILRHHKLFNSNAFLPISADYPGLEGAASSLAMLTGMSVFSTGIIVVGAARLMMMIGLFVLIGGISRSARVAGIGAAVYAANANFLLFGAQFAYESLALPLLVVVLACIAARDRARLSDERAWVLPIVLGIVAIVPTHHLTSYLMIAILLVVTIMRRVSSRFATAPPLWPFLAFAAGLTLAWLVVVASATVGYLSPVVGQAFESTLKTITGETPPRAAFTGALGANQANDLGEKLIGFGSVLLLLVGFVLGFIAAKRRYRFRYQEQTILMILAALGWFAASALRLAPAAWQVGNRLAEFLFIGAGFVIGSIPIDNYRVLRRRWPARAIIAACGAILVIGGAITGWPAGTRLANPTVVAADGHRIYSNPIGFGMWVGSHLPPGTTMVAPDADAATIMVYGQANALTGYDVYADAILTAKTLQSWELPEWRRDHVHYIVVDLRQRATDVTGGYFFGLRPPAGPMDALLPISTATRFDKAGLPRIFDSGDIMVYDLQGSR